MLLTFIILYLCITLAIGWWASRRVKSAADFAVAGRNLPLLVAASALFATWFGSETIMGSPSNFLEEGVQGIITDPLGAALCLILVGVFFARPLYRMNILTFNDFYRMRFGKSAEFVSAIFMIPSYFGWIAAQLVALAIILKTLIGLPIVAGILLCTVVVVLYTYMGGMWAVSITDTFQTVMILLGLIILCVQMTGMAGGLEKVLASQPRDFYTFLPKRSPEAIVGYIAAWITIGLGSIPQQDVFQRVMSSKNERVAVQSSYLSGIMYLTVGMIPLLIALSAQVIYGQDATFKATLQEDGQMLLPQVVLLHSSMAIKVLFFGALLSAVLSTTSGAILAPSIVLSENLIKPRLGEISDKRLMQLMRGSVVFIAAASAGMAMGRQDIHELVAESSALSLVSLFVPMVAGMYWKRATAWGALASMIIGLGTWIVFEFLVESSYPSLIWGLLASILAMVIVSLARPDNSQQQFEEELSRHQAPTA